MSQKIKERFTEAGPRGARLLRMPAVRARSGLSGPTIYRLMREGSFPKPVRIAHQAVAWVESDIDQWIEDKVAAARDRAPAA